MNRPGKNQKEKSADRLPPHSPECEMGILGCIMLSPNASIAECIEKMPSASEMFYDLRNQLIYETLLEMYDKRVEIDPITLQQTLKDKDLLEMVGGLVYLVSLPDSVPSAANLPYYLDFVREKYLLRKIIRTCSEVVGRAYDHEGDVNQLADEVNREISKATDLDKNLGTKNIKELVKDSLSRIEDFWERKGAVTGIATGFADFDAMTSGLQKSEMIVIAARPSMGKTSLAMNIAENVAINSKIPVGVFSLEMSAESLTLRTLCSMSRVNMRDISQGYLAERDFPKITAAAGRIAGAPIYIDDTSSLTIEKLRVKARRMVEIYGVKLFIIDYLQLLRTAKRRSTRQEEVSEISSSIKGLAKELQVPIIVLSQLNREVDREAGRKPRISDLRESGSIEQDADLIGLLYKPQSEQDDPEAVEFAIPVNLLIAKQRNGPTGDVNFTFLKNFTRFENASKIKDYEESQTELPISD